MKKSRIIAIVVSLVLTFALAGTTTFAWFSMNEKVNVEGIDISATTKGGMSIQAKGGTWVTNLRGNEKGMPGYSGDVRLSALLPRTIDTVPNDDPNDILFKELVINNNLGSNDYLVAGNVDRITIANYVEYQEDYENIVNSDCTACKSFKYTKLGASNDPNNDGECDTCAADLTNAIAFARAGFFVQDFTIRNDENSTIYLSYLNVTSNNREYYNNDISRAEVDLTQYTTDANLLNHPRDAYELTTKGDTYKLANDTYVLKEDYNVNIHGESYTEVADDAEKLPVTVFVNEYTTGERVKINDANGKAPGEQDYVDTFKVVQKNCYKLYEGDLVKAEAINAVRIAVLVGTKSNNGTTTTWELLTVLNPNANQGYNLGNLAQLVYNDDYGVGQEELDNKSHGLHDGLVTEYAGVANVNGSDLSTVGSTYKAYVLSNGSAVLVSNWSTYWAGVQAAAAATDPATTAVDLRVKINDANGNAPGEEDYVDTYKTINGDFSTAGLKIANIADVTDDADGSANFGFVEVRFVIWIEGRDGDCMNGIIGDNVGISFSFTSEVNQ